MSEQLADLSSATQPQLNFDELYEYGVACAPTNLWRQVSCSAWPTICASGVMD